MIRQILILILCITAGIYTNSFAQMNPVEESAPAMKVPEGYLLGVGDRLRITYFGQRSLDDEGKKVDLVIQNDGTIYFPLVGEVAVTGLTLKQAEGLLRNKMQKYVVNPVLRIEVLEFLGQKVSLLGSVISQGEYSLPPGMRLANFIARYGGVQPGANLEQITILRSNGDLILIDLNAFFEFGDTSQNILLQPGDRVFVPVKEEKWIVTVNRYLQAVSIGLQIVILLVVI
ncbi:polysaccharide export protein [bacterium]|nr:polysaccharide export protein [bacterium]